MYHTNEANLLCVQTHPVRPFSRNKRDNLRNFEHVPFVLVHPIPKPHVSEFPQRLGRLLIQELSEKRCGALRRSVHFTHEVIETLKGGLCDAVRMENGVVRDGDLLD